MAFDGMCRSDCAASLHFTKVSSVSATFDFRVSAGIVPPEGDARGLVEPLFSLTAAENPTVTIIPI